MNSTPPSPTPPSWPNTVVVVLFALAVLALLAGLLLPAFAKAKAKSSGGPNLSELAAMDTAGPPRSIPKASTQFARPAR